MHKLLPALRRLVKQSLPDYLVAPIFCKSLGFLILPKHHWAAYIQGKYEPSTFACIRSVLKSPKINVFWDVGANCGMFSVLLALNGSQVYAFEPTKEIYSRLHFNMRWLKNATPFNFGLGGRTGDVRMRITDEPGSHFIEPFEDLFDEKLPATASQIVSIKCLKDIITDVPPPDLVKIDVEGYEYEVLREFADFFRDNNSLVIIEIDPKNMEKYCQRPSFVTDLLARKGYNVARIPSSNNYLCVPLTLEG